MTWRGFHSAVRPLVTVLLVVEACVLVALQITVPEWFVTLVISTLGYWFGERSKGS